jgi:hypothetical protein
MTISDYVDAGLDALTADHGAAASLAFAAGAVALGMAALGAVASDKEEKALRALEAARLQVMGLRMVEGGEIQVVIDARDLGRDAAADGHAREREKRAYQVLAVAGLVPLEQTTTDATAGAFVTTLRRKQADRPKTLFERIPPLINFLG